MYPFRDVADILEAPRHPMPAYPLRGGIDSALKFVEQAAPPHDLVAQLLLLIASLQAVGESWPPGRVTDRSRLLDFPKSQVGAGSPGTFGMTSNFHIASKTALPACFALTAATPGMDGRLGLRIVVSEMIERCFLGFQTVGGNFVFGAFGEGGHAIPSHPCPRRRRGIGSALRHGSLFRLLQIFQEGSEG